MLPDHISHISIKAQCSAEVSRPGTIVLAAKPDVKVFKIRVRYLSFKMISTG